MSRHGLTDAGKGHPFHGGSRRDGPRVLRAGERPVTAKEGAGA